MSTLSDRAELRIGAGSKGREGAFARIWPPMLAIGLGIVLLAGAGFASAATPHDAAHDGRHAAGFPCH